MPELQRPDGTRIHYEVGGADGPPVVLATYWSWTPSVYAGLLAELATDHRVFQYHLRGTGQSSRHGPYDLESDRGDLEAVAEQTGGGATVLAIADSANRAVRVAAQRPDLIAAVATFGAAPFARAQFEGEEGMFASDQVVGGFLEMVERSYPSAMRTFMEATNPQMSEDELRDRVATQAEFCEADAAAQRLREWIEDDPRAEAQALGDRLWILTAESVAGAWLPPAEVVAKMTAETLPQAHLVEVDPGPISAPRETADAIRRITGAGRK